MFLINDRSRVQSELRSKLLTGFRLLTGRKSVQFQVQLNLVSCNSTALPRRMTQTEREVK